MDDRRPMRTYGRVKARTLKPRQAALVEVLLPHLALPADGPVDLDAAFGASGATVLEIGFGAGEHLVAQAGLDAERRFIGAEPFLNGVAACLRRIEESGARNVRLFRGDARDLIARLPDHSLDLVYILFPDPWPKARHHKRRLIQPGFLDQLARVLKPGGEVRFATDWAHYAAWTLEHFIRDRRFTWAAQAPADWREPWGGHLATRYEQKRLGDCAPIFLQFRR
jgi:tRNA (guanine-N7-)-methyltransferase